MKKTLISLVLLAATTQAHALNCPTEIGNKFCRMTGQTAGWEAIPKAWGWDDLVIRPSYLTKLTDAKARELVAGKAASFKYLRDLDRSAGLPDGTLGVMWLIESMAGTLNITNGSGFQGHFMFGKAEQKQYGLADPFDFQQAARATTKLLKDYSRISGIPLSTSANCYTLHQQGGTGARIINAALKGEPLPAKIRRNIMNNVPTKAREAFGAKSFHLTSDTKLVHLFTDVWHNEVERLHGIVLEGN